MGSRNRSRRAQLQALLGELGTVRPYLSRANGAVPTAGWYFELTQATAEALKDSGHPPPPGLWMTRDGMLFAGLDTTHAAACIQRVRGLLEI